MNLRKYGTAPYTVVLVHGGPGAPGEMAPVARQLAKSFGVLEPLQTKDSIVGQVAELADQITQNATLPVVLAGWSWGAWLSFILAAEHPKLVKKLILVSSGPFEANYAESIMPTRLSHLSAKDSARVKDLLAKLQKGNAGNAVLEEFGALMEKADSFDPVPVEKEEIAVQADIYEKVWGEAAELRKSGKLLEYAASIQCPVVAIHGDYDSHPADGVKVPLAKHLKNFRFELLAHCGHHPWYEREAKHPFYQVLQKELK